MADLGDEDDGMVFLPRRGWKVVDREESFLLSELLWHRVKPNGRSFIENYHDAKAVAPGEWTALHSERFEHRVFASLEERLELVETVIAPAIAGLHSRAVQIAGRNGIPLVASRAWWWGPGGDEQQLQTTRMDRPADLTHAIVGNSAEVHLWSVVVDICMGKDPGHDARLQRALDEIPLPLIPVVREQHALLMANRPVIGGFRAWILENSAAPIARTRIMEELDRLWPQDPSLRRWAMATFSELETSGWIMRTKKLGRLFYHRGGAA